MANKKATDLGIDKFMSNVKKNKPAKDTDKQNIVDSQKELVPLEAENESEDIKSDESKDKVEEKKIMQETILRNVVLTPEVLYRLETVQKMQNKRISLGGLMGEIIEVYLDANYPQTKELYKLMESMKK